MSNLKELLKIQEIVDQKDQKDLNEYIEVLIEIEKEYTE